MSSLALRRRLAALEAQLGERADREAAQAEFDGLVRELDRAVQAAKERVEADDLTRRAAGLPRSVETLVQRDPDFANEIGRIQWRVL
ncbi:MAG: hypothetical protein C3F11_17335 [Methylocystaceae bacterium]|nr:MAG: hypothetical protein C3F11_17335 [Methylocystaceae bacterium]